MMAFNKGDRVRVTGWEPLNGLTGTVVRVQKSTGKAWVEMEDPVPAEIRNFPVGDPLKRENWQLLAPGECEKA